MLASPVGERGRRLGRHGTSTLDLLVGVRPEVGVGFEVLHHLAELPGAGEEAVEDLGRDRASLDGVTLLGVEGDDRISAEEWADRIGTINYEVFCGIGKRVPRVYRGKDSAAGSRKSGADA